MPKLRDKFSIQTGRGHLTLNSIAARNRKRPVLRFYCMWVDWTREDWFLLELFTLAYSRRSGSQWTCHAINTAVLGFGVMTYGYSKAKGGDDDRQTD